MLVRHDENKCIKTACLNQFGQDLESREYCYIAILKFQPLPWISVGIRDPSHWLAALWKSLELEHSGSWSFVVLSQDRLSWIDTSHEMGLWTVDNSGNYSGGPIYPQPHPSTIDV